MQARRISFLRVAKVDLLPQLVFQGEVDVEADRVLVDFYQVYLDRPDFFIFPGRLALSPLQVDLCVGQNRFQFSRDRHFAKFGVFFFIPKNQIHACNL